MRVRLALPLLAATLGSTLGAAGCKFPYPGDVIDGDAGPGMDADHASGEWTFVTVNSSTTEPARWYRIDGTGKYVSMWSSTEMDFGSALAVGDFDGDHDEDLAVANFSLGRDAPLSIYRNDGQAFTLTWTITRTRTNLALAWGDVDRDGDPDLIVASLEGVYLHRNRTARFDEVVQLLPDAAVAIDLADMDGDGDLDLAAADSNNPASVYRNDGTGTFQRTSWNGPSDGVSVKFGDYDADGDRDLAVGRLHGFTIYRADGTTLQESFDSADLRPSYTARTNVTWFDGDGDHDLDLIVGDYTTLSTTPRAAAPVQVIRNLGGGFAGGWTAPDVSYATSVAAADFDGDGDADLLVGNDGSPCRLYANTGADTFVPTWTSVESAHTWAVGWLPVRRP